MLRRLSLLVWLVALLLAVGCTKKPAPVPDDDQQPAAKDDNQRPPKDDKPKDDKKDTAKIQAALKKVESMKADNGATFGDNIKAGKLRALAVTTARRQEALPNVPAMSDFLPDFEASAWLGLGAPKNTPHAVIRKLNNEINAALADFKMKARLADLGLSGLPGSPADFEKLVADDVAKWAKVVKFAGLKSD